MKVVVVIVRKRFPMKKLIDFEILKANCGKMRNNMSTPES